MFYEIFCPLVKYEMIYTAIYFLRIYVLRYYQ